MLRNLFFALLSPALLQPAHAVVVLSGAANNTAPAGQPYFGNLGTIGSASAIYQGDRWVLTAAHVADKLPSSATFGGISYATTTGTYQRLENPAGYGFSTLTDLAMFRLGTDPGLPTLSITSATASINDPVMMIGAGRQQLATKSYWQVTPVAGNNNDIWEPRTPPEQTYNAYGYETIAGTVPRWGVNDIAAVNQNLSIGFGNVRTFFTTFDDGAYLHEAQAVSGDSGGAVLRHNGLSWELAGVMLAVATYDNQPGGANTAVVGNLTYAADLGFYRNQILAIIPEPHTEGLLFVILTVSALLLRHRPSLTFHPGQDP